MPDDELDELYLVKPDGFTALRQKLAAAAKQRGDAAAAKRISASRKPTTAAWVVNQFALRHKETHQRLGDLRKRLRAAHAAMDGERIQRLSIEQRHLIDELTRAAFQTAGVQNPSAAQRDDVTATLQAAVADPDVTARLGRLSAAEHWSGFGDFGPLTQAPEDATEVRRRDKLDKLRAALADAEQAKAKADDALRQAERDLDTATKAYDKAKQASRDAAASVREAKARLRA